MIMSACNLDTKEQNIINAPPPPPHLPMMLNFHCPLIFCLWTRISAPIITFSASRSLKHAIIVAQRLISEHLGIFNHGDTLKSVLLFSQFII